MSAALRRLHAERRRYSIDEETFRAILLGQIGRESSKGITMAGANACIREFAKYKPELAPPSDENPDGWRRRSDDPLVRKIYALWTVLRNGGVVQPRFPDAYVKRMTKADRADFLTPVQCNTVIEGLKEIIDREGLGGGNIRTSRR
ncbi:regulatory protein GemA [Algimonas porphyrae]|uniref:Mu-like prophage protein gp16 n=1 Tax=Algimonas porphyrae TaxID=1128113 RepID=A0ABQ5UZZ9_9PROT|nr:regulatory protein GemA [Algimonas porphyrae]GLQ20484.1 hypothetical protein GCM10007854_14390 [Algimonas porphyrae]